MKITNILLFIIVLLSITLTIATTTGTTNNEQKIKQQPTQPIVNKLEARLFAPTDAKFSSYRIKLRDINNYNEIIEIPSRDGQFSFTNITNGLYSLEIESMQYAFPEYRVDVLGKKQIKVRSTDNDTAIIQLPLQIKAVSKIPFFQQHVPFSILSMVQNPMAISILFTCALIFVLPKMTSFIDQDEETKESLKASTPTLVQQLPEFNFQISTKLLEN